MNKGELYVVEIKSQKIIGELFEFENSKNTALKTFLEIKQDEYNFIFAKNLDGVILAVVPKDVKIMEVL